jgi:hypothetical protein
MRQDEDDKRQRGNQGALTRVRDDSRRLVSSLETSRGRQDNKKEKTMNTADKLIEGCGLLAEAWGEYWDRFLKTLTCQQQVNCPTCNEKAGASILRNVMQCDNCGQRLPLNECRW